MKKIINIIGFLFLVGCGVVLYKNYIVYDLKTDKPKNDTIMVDTTIVDTTIIDTLVK